MAAKYTSKAADDFELQKALTPNQDDVFGWITDPKYKGKLDISYDIIKDKYWMCMNRFSQ